METPEGLRQSANATVRYETRPGKQLQADFCEGIPEQVLVDNAKALITLKNPRTGALVVNPTIAAFARHWGFTAKACWPHPATGRGEGHGSHGPIGG